MSFFVKGKPRTVTKRKFDKTKPEKKEKVSRKQHEEEELHSDEENLGSENVSYIPLDDGEDFVETPQDKRLRLAKKYLNDMKETESSKFKEEDVHGNISQLLKEEYLDSIGKLHRSVAHKYNGFDSDNISVLKYKHQKLTITCVCMTDDDKYLYVGNKNGIIVKWDLEKMERVQSIVLRKSTIDCLAVSFDAKFLAVADGSNNIRICCGETLKTLEELEGHGDVVTSLVFRKNSHFLYSASKDRSIKSWSLIDMAYIETLYGHQCPITSIDALSRERAVSSGGADKTIRIWKITEESQLVYEGHTDSIECVKLIGEEYFISCGSDGSLSTWSTSKKRPLCTVKFAHGKSQTGEPNWITSIATFLNTDIIASGSSDGFIRVWKLENKNKNINLLFQIPVEGFVNSLAFTNDGTKLVAAIGQEHKLGRWWRIKEAKNTTIVIPFNVDNSKPEVD